MKFRQQMTLMSLLILHRLNLVKVGLWSVTEKGSTLKKGGGGRPA